MIAVIAALLLLIAVPAAAHADVAFTPCGELECGRVAVPLDHAGRVAGSLSIAVYRAPATVRPARGVLLGLPGGPGDSGGAYFARRLARFAGVRSTHDLVFVDPRGTGASGALRCGDAGSCAQVLGPASGLYTSRDVADDVEAVRAALGVERLALYGISYGTWFAQTYARRHPSRVAALVLDAPVSPASQDDVFRTKLFAALPRAVRAICRTGCAGRDPYRDLAAVTASLARRPASARVVDARGRAREEPLDPASLLMAVIALDVNPALRGELPAALAAARAGDHAPLARLVDAAGTSAPEDPAFSSRGANVVTQCEELGMPWPRDAPLDGRGTAADRAFARIPASAFEPFGRAVAPLLSNAAPCEQWPARPEDPLVRGPLPAVPTLVLSGEADLRTPPADAEEVVASSPGARLVTTRNAGHGALVEAPGCAPAVVVAFLAGRSERCRATTLRPRPPFSRARVRATRRGVVTAAVLTATDALHQAAMRLDGTRGQVERVRFGGLRGGWSEGTAQRVRLRGAVLVPGLAVSGTASPGRHDLRVRGALSGSLHLRGLRVTGSLGGRRVDVTVKRAAVGAGGVRAAEIL